MDLVERIRSGNKRTLSKLITEVEYDTETGREALRELYKYTGNAHVVGITGSPGVGKSTLVARIVKELRKREISVGVVAVDPSSPFTGGAILGDRIRMQELACDPEVFIRSVSSSAGTVGRTTKNIIRVLDAAGKDVIVIETIGAGQVDLDVLNVADTKVIVLMPESGDEIQMIKAGLLEIGDVYVINKADLENAARTKSQLSLAIKERDGWIPEIVMTIATSGEGVEKLVDAIFAHKKHLEDSSNLRKGRLEAVKSEVVEILVEKLKMRFYEKFSNARYSDIFEQVLDKELDPFTAAELIEKEEGL
jgi:LAO/AO transport system kinase